MFRATGKGEVDVVYATSDAVNVRLYNFDFDDINPGTKLKGAHVDFLDQNIVQLLKYDRGAVWLTGSASRIGDANYNMALSKVRVERVAAYLRTRGVTPGQMQLDAIGEEQAQRHALDDPRDRAVILW